MSWRTCWRTCRVAASSSSSSSRCLGASRRSEDQPPLHLHLPLCRLVHLWTNRPSSATSCRWRTAATAAAAAPPTSTEPSLPSAPQVRLAVSGSLGCLIKQIFIISIREYLHHVFVSGYVKKILSSAQQALTVPGRANQVEVLPRSGVRL